MSRQVVEALPSNRVAAEGAAIPAARPVGRNADMGGSATRRNLVRRLFLPPMLVLVVAGILGAPYYLLPIGERVRHGWHVWLKPSGLVGQSAGMLALALFLFMWLYPMRKRIRRGASGASLKIWLDVHIVAGLLLPLVGAIHAAFRFNGLIGLGYFSMLTVSLSGIVGRYLYMHIPRSRTGLELTLDEVERRRRALIQQIASTTGLGCQEVESVLALRSRGGGSGLIATLTQLLAGDFVRWKATRALRKRWSGEGQLDPGTLAEVIDLAKREIGLTQQVLMLNGTQKVFRFWHVAHMPFAITAFGAVLVHVVVVAAMGVTWLW